MHLISRFGSWLCGGQHFVRTGATPSRTVRRGLCNLGHKGFATPGWPSCEWTLDFDVGRPRVLDKS